MAGELKNLENPSFVKKEKTGMVSNQRAWGGFWSFGFWVPCLSNLTKTHKFSESDSEKERKREKVFWV